MASITVLIAISPISRKRSSATSSAFALITALTMARIISIEIKLEFRIAYINSRRLALDWDHRFGEQANCGFSCTSIGSSLGFEMASLRASLISRLVNIAFTIFSPIDERLVVKRLSRSVRQADLLVWN